MKTHSVVANHSDWVVVDKEAGVLSVPPRFPDKDSRPILGRLLETELQCRLFPVHRLDYEVSGLLIFAKNPETQKRLSQCFESRRAQKTYEALVASPPSSGPSTWENKIVRGKKRSFYAPHGQDSVTLLRSVTQVPKTSFWKLLLEPKTGRPHQLRLDCSQNLSPIVGDQLYGSTMNLQGNAIALRAVRLELPDLSTTVFEVPSGIPQWLERLRESSPRAFFE